MACNRMMVLCGQWRRAGHFTVFDFGMARRAQRNQIGQLVGLLPVALEKAIGPDVVNAAPRLSARLTYSRIASACSFGLRNPIGAAFLVRCSAAPIGIFGAMQQFAMICIGAFRGAILSIEQCDFVALDFNGLAAPFALQCHSQIAGRIQLATTLRTSVTNAALERAHCLAALFAMPVDFAAVILPIVIKFWLAGCKLGAALIGTKTASATRPRLEVLFAPFTNALLFHRRTLKVQAPSNSTLSRRTAGQGLHVGGTKNVLVRCCA